MPDTLEDDDWLLLMERIKDQKCTPFIGAGACHGSIPLGADIAHEWAMEYDYPLEDDYDLVRVAQYIAIRRDGMAPKEKILKEFSKVTPPDFTNPSEPHGWLARLNLPLYITTNYDNFMFSALVTDMKKEPKREVCRWNSNLKQRFKGQLSLLDSKSGFQCLPERPVIFNLHGNLEYPESILLTEDDYLDFLVNISKDPHIIPRMIQSALATTSLLFVGYRIADWNFPVLFRSLTSYLDENRSKGHIYRSSLLRSKKT